MHKKIETMSQHNEYVAAIDLGTTKIVTLIGKKNSNNKIDIVAHSNTPSTGIRRGIVHNIEETVASIRQTVEKVQLESGIIFSEVFVGIAGQHIKTLKTSNAITLNDGEEIISLDNVNALIEDTYKIVLEPGEEILHALPQNFTVDNEPGIRNPVGVAGKKLWANFHIVIGQTQSAQNIEKCVNRIDLAVKDLILEPLASAEAVLTEDEKEAGVVLLDIGGGTTDIAIFYDGIVRHTAVIPFGGGIITHDIKEGCAILERYAEKLKMQFGSALGDIAPDNKVVTIPGISGREPKEISFKSLAYIIQSRMEEILGFVNFEIENSGYADKLNAGIVLTGGGARLRHLSQLVKFNTGYDVRIGFPTEHLSAESADTVSMPELSTGIGLIIKGFEFMESENTHQEPKAEPAKKLFAFNKQKSTEVKKKNMLERFKTKVTEMFDENDAEM